MQCRNGGWASFDKNNDRMVFQYVPFADHNAMLDPPTVDITGRMLEMLATYGYTKDHPRCKKAIQFIRRRAGAGRLLVWPLGRELHLRHHAGAARPGSDRRRSPRALCAAGGGVAAHGAESRMAAGAKPAAPTTIPTPEGAGRARLRRPRGRSWVCWRRMIRAAIVWRVELRICCARRKRDGSWDEPSYTGTGFPRVFYLAYHMYRQYFPLIA